jgi:nucleotide-binding universal stress UspA family protein
MKKILAAFDGVKYSDGASKYAIEIAKATNSMLIGVFVQDMRYLNFTYAYAWDQPFIDFNAIETSQKEEKEKVDLNIQLFKRACDEGGVHHKIHLDKGVPLQALLDESTFADLIIIDSHTSFFSLGDKNISPFLKELLADSHCPVLIVPRDYKPFDKVVLCYDGSPSSVYAIKMFNYIFPEFKDLSTVVLTVNEKSTNHVKEGWNFKDLVRVHYGEAAYEVLRGDAETGLIEYLKTQGEKAVVVMGAYSRSAISRLFHQSISNRIIQEIKIPVFITHQ